MRLTRTTIATPLGDMLALASDEGLCALEFTGPKKRLTRLETRLRRWFPPHEIVDADTRIFGHARTWLSKYFDGAAADVGDLPLDMHGAPFEKRVWRALLDIPSGQTTSYGAIAKKLGSAGASRAVGTAVGRNPISWLVPCHRVLGSDGALHGYHWGLERKRAMLAVEAARRDQSERSRTSAMA